MSKILTVEERLHAAGINKARIKQIKDEAEAAGRPIPTLNELLESVEARELNAGGETASGSPGAGQPKTLDEALRLIAQLRGSAQARANELAVDRVRNVVGAAVDAANEASEATISELRGQLAKATGTIADLNATIRNSADVKHVDALRSERDNALARVEATNKQMRLLEGFSGVRGVAAADVPPAIDDPSAAGGTVADYDRRLQNAKTPEEAAAITKEFEKAYADKLIRPDR